MLAACSSVAQNTWSSERATLASPVERPCRLKCVRASARSTTVLRRAKITTPAASTTSDATRTIPAAMPMPVTNAMTRPARNPSSPSPRTPRTVMTYRFVLGPQKNRPV